MSTTQPAPLPEPPKAIKPNAHIRRHKEGRWYLVDSETDQIGESFTSGIVTSAQLMRTDSHSEHFLPGKIIGDLTIYEQLPMRGPAEGGNRATVTYDKEMQVFRQRVMETETPYAPYMLLHADGTMTGFFK